MAPVALVADVLVVAVVDRDVPSQLAPHTRCCMPSSVMSTVFAMSTFSAMTSRSVDTRHVGDHPGTNLSRLGVDERQHRNLAVLPARRALLTLTMDDPNGRVVFSARG